MSDPPVAGVVLAAGTSSRMDAFKLLLPYGEGSVVEASTRAALEAGLDPVVVVTGHRSGEVRRALEDRFGPQGGSVTPAPPGDEGDAVDAARGGDLRVVFNPRFPEGLSASLLRGLVEVRTATAAPAAAVLLADEPGLAPAAVREVVEAWRRRARRRDRDASAAASGSPRGRGDGTPAPSGGADPGAPRPGPPAAGPAAVIRTRYRDRPGHPVVLSRDVFPELEALEGDRGAGRWLERIAGRVEEVRIDARAPVDVDTDDDYRRARGR